MNVHCSTVYNGKKIKKRNDRRIAKTAMEYPQWEILPGRFSRHVTAWKKKKKLQNDIKVLYVNLRHIYTVIFTNFHR